MSLFDHCSKCGQIHDLSLKCTQTVSDIPKGIHENKTPERIAFEESLKADTQETSFNDINETLGITIKHDDPVKQITFAIMLLNYLGDNQTNLVFKSESSKGKTYIVQEVAKYYPEDDVITLHKVSPTAFFHLYGVPIMEEYTAQNGETKQRIKYYLVDLERKIMIFLDQPNNALLEVMRPMLSHDKKELLSYITDKSKEGANRTKQVMIRGFPTMVYCTAKMLIDEQEATRMIQLSPSGAQEKLIESCHSVGEREANPTEYARFLEENEDRAWLRNRIELIKNAKVENVNIPDIETVWTQFREDHKWLLPRHMRDYPRLLLLIKASALLNYANRKKAYPLNYNDLTPAEKAQVPNIINANGKDMEEGFRLYETIRESNELGIPPEIYEIFTEIIKPLLDEVENPIVSNRDIVKKYYQVTKRALSERKLREVILAQLEAVGLIAIEKDQVDKRRTLVKYPYDKDSKDITRVEGGRDGYSKEL